MAAGSTMRPFGHRTGRAFSTVACILFIVGSATYLGVCQRGDLSFCPAWAGGWQGFQSGSCSATQRGAQVLGGERTFLPPSAIERGTSNYGTGLRMERLGQKLLQGQSVTVTFLGGSITWGRGGYEGGSFVQRFSAWLNATFPLPEGHRVINQGLPAVTSALFAACYDKVPEDSDLVVLDFAVNDGHISPPGRDRQGYAFSGGARRGFEQLLRKSLKLRAQPAVTLLHFFSWNATRDKVEVDGLDVPVGDSFFWRTIEDDLSTAAQYYDAPALSLRNAVYHLLREQRHGFRWDVGVHTMKDVKAGEDLEQLKDSQFFWDENHPWDRTGHRALAELLMAAVSRGVQAAAAAQQRQSGQLGLVPPPPPLPGLPPPMVTDNYEANATSCHLQEEFQGVIATGEGTKGFSWEPRAPQEVGFIAQKWGLTTNKSGAVAALELDTSLGGVSGKGKAVQLHLLYLRSWRDMGRAALTCARGCKCDAVELDGHWEREATITDLYTLQVSPHPRCRLELKVVQKSSSGGHAFSLSGIVVSSVDAKMERGKIGQWEYDKGST